MQGARLRTYCKAAQTFRCLGTYQYSVNNEYQYFIFGSLTSGVFVYKLKSFNDSTCEFPHGLLQFTTAFMKPHGANIEYRPHGSAVILMV